MKITLKAFLSVLATGLIGSMVLGGTAQALPSITGGISYAGGYTPETSANVVVTDLTLADKIVFAPTGFTLGAGSGSFAGIGNFAPVTLFGPLIINPITPLSPLYSVGGFTFSLTTLSVGPTATTPLAMALQGTGVFSAAGFANTNGTWVATFNTTSGTYSFSASSGVPVPDGGSTVALVGLALVGVEGLRRKLGAGATKTVVS